MENKLVKLSLALILASATLKVMAADEKIVCPSVNLVKQSWTTLDTVTKYSSSKFFISNNQRIQDLDHRYWTIVTFATANSMDTALEMGQNNTKNITVAMDKYADDAQFGYICKYSSDASTPVNVWVYSLKDDDNNDIKITSINYNLLK